MTERIFVVIPAHNESRHIVDVIRKTKKYCKNIIIVDDGSTDPTYPLAESEKVTVLRHFVNMGKGAALKTGCEFALRSGADIIIVMDSDGQHQPDDIPRFIKSIRGKDVVFGSRSFNRKMPAILKFGNWFINKTNEFLFGIKLLDTQSGFRAFTSKAYRKLRWDSQDYSVESEMIANTGRAGLRISEIRIKTIYSDRYKGTTILDGVKIVLMMIWWRITKWH